MWKDMSAMMQCYFVRYESTSPANWAKTCAVSEQTDKGIAYKRVKIRTDIQKNGQILKQTCRQKYGEQADRNMERHTVQKWRDKQKL